MIPKLVLFFSQPSLISFKRDKDMGNFFLSEVQHIQTNDQHGTSKACAHDAKLAPLFIT